MEHTNNFRYWL